MMTLKFDPEKHFLGKLCKRSHDYEKTGKSLRIRKKGTCALCIKQYHQEYQKTEKWKKYLKEYEKKRKDPQKEYQKEHRNKPGNIEKYNQYHREYYHRKKENKS